jgi:hypothetical protein
MVSFRPRSRAWITLLDAALMACAAAAIVVILGGRTRLALAGVRLAFRTPVNLVIFLTLGTALRLWIARGIRLLPSLTPPDRTRLDEERERFVRTAVRPRAFVLYAAAAALASVLWLTPNLLHPRRVPDRGDPVFSAWRLARFSHQLVHDPRHLFDGNIFHPASGTLTFSDATVLQGLAAAPFIQAGADPLLVSNLLLLITFPLNALAFFHAGWRLTGDLRPAFVAGVLGALYPFHGEHYSHLELEYTFFIPLAIVALLDAIARPAPRRGAWLGLLLAAQWLASMYLGLMLLTFVVPFGALVALAWRPPIRSLVKALVPAAAIAATAFAALGIPYLRTDAARGGRSLALAAAFSAEPREYGHPHGRLPAYQWITRENNRMEREMFPGFMVLGTAAVGAAPPLAAAPIASLVSGALAFDWSLGPYGLTYDDLYHWLLPYRGLRVPARFSMFVGTALILLGAAGSRRIIDAAARARLATPVFACLAAAALFDLRLDLRMLDYWKEPPPIYASVTPSMVLAEFPWEENAQDYMYFSTRHWARLLNGYSGSFPDAFIDLQKRLETFPAPDAIEAVRAAGATHVTFNCTLEPRKYRCLPTIDALDANPSLELVSGGRWEGDEVRLYRLK